MSNSTSALTLRFISEADAITVIGFRKFVEKMVPASHSGSPKPRLRLVPPVCLGAPLLIDAIRIGSGQSAKIEELLWSTWNGDHNARLCDCLSGLDSNLAQAVLAKFADHSHCGGDAEPILKKTSWRAAPARRKPPLPQIQPGNSRTHFNQPQ